MKTLKIIGIFLWLMVLVQAGCSKKPQATGCSKKPQAISSLATFRPYKTFQIEALDGKAYISDAEKVFKYIDSNFKEWRLNRSGWATNKTLVDVSRITSRGDTDSEIFTSINPDIKKLVMTQAQIISFCEKHHSNQFHFSGCSTFFLTKVGDEYFVVIVTAYHDEVGLDVYVYPFKNSGTWCNPGEYRVVVPRQLAS